ncbi:hypothetical protein PhCBS80983_g01939 [Powellomyces hirtus]|uniref:WSC domain-containing protein n=1 Tax=Powellomyces hirtus TaxID=109895 RepID=A0A507E820_9FUNG|nr:hypothetical protein PhCBS80983_g01939 [Powellomyces hirtus]
MCAANTNAKAATDAANTNAKAAIDAVNENAAAAVTPANANAAAAVNAATTNAQAARHAAHMAAKVNAAESYAATLTELYRTRERILQYHTGVIPVKREDEKHVVGLKHATTILKQYHSLILLASSGSAAERMERALLVNAECESERVREQAVAHLPITVDATLTTMDDRLLWTSDGCVSLSTPLAPPPVAVSLPPGSSLTTFISTCTTRCALDSNAPYALLAFPLCHCLAPTGSPITRQNSAECALTCDGGLPCGSTVPNRYSLYLTGLSQVPPLPQASASVPPPPPTPAGAIVYVTTTVTALPTPPATGAPRAAAGQINRTPSTKNIETTVAISISALVLFLALLAGLIYKLRQRRSLQHLPHLDHASLPSHKLQTLALETRTKPASVSALPAAAVLATTTIPVLSHQGGPTTAIPKTPNMIYSVTSNYSARAGSDEIDLHVDNVVALRKTFQDGWATGMNVSTGQLGTFPLACLVSDDNWVKKAWGLPDRDDSLTG